MLIALCGADSSFHSHTGGSQKLILGKFYVAMTAPKIGAFQHFES